MKPRSCIAHISDLHFGREDPNVADALLKDIVMQNPDLVVVSGDLTQRARSREFQKAADYLRQLPMPILVVPGNHDVPLHNIARRLLRPWQRYQTHIAEDLGPQFATADLAVLGINTASRYTWKSGVIKAGHLREIERFFAAHQSACKILVSHHPLLAEFSAGKKHTWRSGKLREILCHYHIDIVLSGHLHQSYSASAHIERLDNSHACVTIQAGTALSTRQRLETNAYNLLRFQEDCLNVKIRIYKENQFVSGSSLNFVRQNICWKNADRSP